jgi:hypothetical protein
MAAGTRVQIVMPVPLARALQQQADREGRSLSSMGTALIEAGLRDRSASPKS